MLWLTSFPFVPSCVKGTAHLCKCARSVNVLSKQDIFDNVNCLIMMHVNNYSAHMFTLYLSDLISLIKGARFVQHVHHVTITATGMAKIMRFSVSVSELKGNVISIHVGHSCRASNVIVVCFILYVAVLLRRRKAKGESLLLSVS